MLKVFELCLSSPQSHLFLLCFEMWKTAGIGSEPCFPPLVWLVGSVFKVGTTSVWRTLCPPCYTLVHVLASMARCCILLCCVYVCVRAVLMCMCMCVFCTCVCVWPYVRLCSFLTVCLAFFGNLFGISTNEAQFYWLFSTAIFLTFLVGPCYNVIINQGGNGYG